MKKFIDGLIGKDNLGKTAVISILVGIFISAVGQDYIAFETLGGLFGLFGLCAGVVWVHRRYS